MRAACSTACPAALGRSRPASSPAGGAERTAPAALQNQQPVVRQRQNAAPPVTLPIGDGDRRQGQQPRHPQGRQRLRGAQPHDGGWPGALASSRAVCCAARRTGPGVLCPGSLLNFTKGNLARSAASPLQAIMGPSGCGKTTLLDTLAGRLAHTARHTGGPASRSAAYRPKQGGARVEGVPRALAGNSGRFVCAQACCRATSPPAGDIRVNGHKSDLSYGKSAYVTQARVCRCLPASRPCLPASTAAPTRVLLRPCQLR